MRRTLIAFFAFILASRGVDAQGEPAIAAPVMQDASTQMVQAVGTSVPRSLADRFSDALNVKDFGARGDGVTDDTAAINQAIAAGIARWQLHVEGQGIAYSARAATVVFPPGIYVISSTLRPSNGYQAFCNLEGIGNATLLYTGAGAAVSASVADPTRGNATLVVPLSIRNLSIRKAPPLKTAGSVGLHLGRIGQPSIDGVAIFGFDRGIENFGAEGAIYDFHSRAGIERVNVGILIQQSTAPDGTVVKPNRTTVRDGYFIDNAVSAIVIRRNPEESLANNGGGGMISLVDLNIQSESAGPAISVEYAGEVPGQGTVQIDRVWFEAFGRMALAVTASTVTMTNCMVVNGTLPIQIDRRSRLVLNQFEAYFTVRPQGAGSVISRFDGTTDGIARQVQSMGAQIYSDGIAPVPLGPGDSVAPTGYTLDSLVVSPRHEPGGVVVDAPTYPQVKLDRAGATKGFLGISGERDGWVAGTAPDSVVLYGLNRVHLSSRGALTMTLDGNATRFAGPVSPGTPQGLTQVGAIYQGSGAPPDATGRPGDIYFRTDTPEVPRQRMYIRTEEGWCGLL
jgi:hypothetical protein